MLAIETVPAFGLGASLVAHTPLFRRISSRRLGDAISSVACTAAETAESCVDLLAVVRSGMEQGAAAPAEAKTIIRVPVD